jgi:hypothetical protein
LGDQSYHHIQKYEKIEGQQSSLVELFTRGECELEYYHAEKNVLFD